MVKKLAREAEISEEKTRSFYLYHYLLQRKVVMRKSGNCPYSIPQSYCPGDLVPSKDANNKVLHL